MKSKSKNYKLDKLNNNGYKLCAIDTVYSMKSSGNNTKEIIKKIKNDFSINLNTSEVKSLFSDKSFNEFDQLLSQKNLFY